MTTGVSDLQVIVPYCERLATGGEPVNTLSNAGFVLVALYGWSLWRRNSRSLASVPANPEKSAVQSNAIPLLLLLCLLIGAGSSLFHANPGPITHLIDIVPVCLFSLLALWLCLKRYQWPRHKSLGLLVIWVAATAVAAQFPQVLAHSLFYLPTVLVLVYLAFALKQQRQRLSLLAAVFASALTFRALDLPLCELEHSNQTVQTIPALAGLAGHTGTHFLWHVLTAIACIVCLHLVLGRDSTEA